MMPTLANPVETLNTLEQRIKAAARDYEYKKIRHDLVRLDTELPRTFSFSRARFHFLAGVFLSKLVLTGPNNVLTDSSVETLSIATKHFSESCKVISRLLESTGLSGAEMAELNRLERQCIYECAVAGTTLRSWDENVSFAEHVPRYERLGPPMCDQIKNAFRRRRPLRSKFFRQY